MTTSDISMWTEALGTCRSERIKVIQDLLKHAKMDHMSQEDLDVCHDTLKVLRVLPDDGLKPIPPKRLVVRDYLVSEADDDEELATV
jgi:hypothetical protein